MSIENITASLIAAVMGCICPILTLFDLPGNTTIMLAALGFILYNPDLYLQVPLAVLMLFVYTAGELWEFIIGFFGIKKEKVPWSAVFLIGIGGFIGTIIGTGMLPVLGSFIGGVIGAFCMAFLYEYLKTSNHQDAFQLAWKAAKFRFLALLGKFIAGLVLAILLAKLVIFR